MTARKLLAVISRSFLKDHEVYIYGKKEIKDLNDEELIKVCQRYYEDYDLIKEFKAYRKNAESGYRNCPYLGDYIEAGDCRDIQKVAFGRRKSAVMSFDLSTYENAQTICGACKHKETV